MMIALKTYQNGGSNTGSKHVGSPKTNPAVGRNHRQIPQPIKSWTSKPVRINGKPRENGIITSPRMLTGGLTGKATAVPVKQSVGGEWSLKECEEHTAWVNGLLKKARQRPIGDLRKSLSDGLMLVTLTEILFHSKISGIQTRPIIRAQRLENIHVCFRFLEGKGVETKQLSPEEVTDGNLQAALDVVSAIRRRFETNYTGSSNSIKHGTSMNSIDRSENSSMQLTAREGSIHSQVSGGSLAHTPRSIHNGDAKGHVNGDILPGTMADSLPEDSPRISTDQNNIISTTTEISTQGPGGSLQHGVEMRRQKFRDIPATSQTAIRPQPLRPPPMAWNSASLTNGKSPAVRESLSMTVEERLKSLLDTPNPGGMSGGSQYLYDEGELLELPPPKLRSYLNDDDDDDDDDNAEESQLHAMLEDPDKFEDYPKDWDRYVSGYVPSSKAEKKEGPRAQGLLEQHADNTPPTSQPHLPFFHAPPTQHMGPMQNAPNTNGYHNGHDPTIMHGRTNAEPNGMYTMQTPNSRLHNPAYQTPNSPGTQRFMPPSYQDHIQRHPTPQYSRSRGHDPASRVNDPDGTGGGATTPSAFRPAKNYDVPRPGDHLHQGQPLINHHVHDNRTPGNNNIPMESIRPNHAYSNLLHRSNHDHRNTNIAMTLPMDRVPPSRTLNEPSVDVRGFQSFVPSPDSSSSRSNTPELPPLSPATTPSDTPPASPELTVKRKIRSISASSFPYSLRSSHSGGKDNDQVSQGGSVGKKKGRSPSDGRRAETKQSSGNSVGKGKRKMQTRQRASTLQSGNGDVTQKKKTSKGLLNTHRHDGLLASSDSDDGGMPPAKPERKPKKRIPSSVPQPPTMEDHDDMEGPSADGIRQQLMGLESMYKEILTVIGTNKGEGDAVKKPVRRQVSKMASPRATVAQPKTAAKSHKQREKDIKTVNKRFARVESHVVTLARSVASLSSELRSQNAILREIDSLRCEVDEIRETSFNNSSRDSMFTPGPRFRPILSPHTSPQKIKKLTKFFGEEPPLLQMFLQELGYERYVAIFEKEGIGMLELPYLSEERLELIGIPIGPRLRILQEAQLMV